ncbi:hypothetical protein FRB96_008551 [Tulasnella sp. 330]|nr:hypothetical protein FRB96_008551 [Tulasnella sp. 330]
MDRTESVADFAQQLRTPPPVEWLSFSGETSDNVLLFAQAIHRFGFAHGRHEHDAWMAAYAYGCLKDTALDWFEDLEPEVKRDWSTLRPAMIKRFRQDKAAKNSASHARVMLVKDNGLVVGYVGPLPAAGHMEVQAEPEGALVLDIPNGQSSQQTGDLIRLAGSGDDSHPFAGIERFNNLWILRACDQGRDGEIFKGRTRAISDTASPIAASKIWIIQKVDEAVEELRIQWKEDDGSECMLLVIIACTSVISECGLLGRTPLQAVQLPRSQNVSAVWDR